MRSVLVGDLGGTKCRFGLVSEDAAVHAQREFRTVHLRTDRTSFLAEVQRRIGEVLAARPAHVAPPVAFGVGTAGVIPLGGRTIATAPNLPLDGFDLAAHLETGWGLPTTLINDGRASAWGEYRVGSARGKDPLLCLFFGTGIGIGYLFDGRPYGGADNAAGEIGHTLWVAGGRRCPCGVDGHFEAYCGGRAIDELATAALGPGPLDAQGEPRWTAGAVAGSSHPAAAAILAAAEVAACALTANACTLLNPRAVVLGGGVLEGWPALRAAIPAFVRKHCSRPITEHLEFHASLAGSDAILIGAAAATGALWAAAAPTSLRR